MKFEDLFNKVFISERQDEIVDDTEIADPDNFDDVDPLPLPKPTAEVDPNMPVDGQQQTETPASANTVGDYISELEDFANKLNGTETTSLQSLVSQLDRPGTPFDGISGRTRTEIVRVAETLRSISENLKSFMINAAKK